MHGARESGSTSTHLEDAVAVAGVAEVLEPEVALILRELVAKRLLELGEARAHDTPLVPPPGGGVGEGPEPRPGSGAGPLRGRRGLRSWRSRRLRHARVRHARDGGGIWREPNG
jgi:hypothetical protein